MANKDDLTDEQAAEMEAKLNAHRAKKQQERNAQMREDAKPLLDIVNGDHFKAMQAAVPILLQLGDKAPQLGEFRVHVEALRLGLKGILDTASSIPADVPANQQVIDQ